MKDDLDACMFVVFETPYCVVDVMLPERNLEFIRGLQPGYFSYLASIHEKGLEGSDRNLAAMSLRSAYVQGLETFFAILFSTLQAPDCVAGWLAKYQLGDLRSLVEYVKNQRPFKSRVILEKYSWQGIVEAIHKPFKLEDKAKNEEVKGWVKTLWSHLANDFLNEITSLEYNSIKHGLRARPGGFRLAFAPEKGDGSKPADADYHSFGGSEYGSAFFKPESLGHKNHFRLRRTHVNWHPDNLVASLHLISQSLTNLVSFLEAAHGVHKTEFGWPMDKSAFDSIRAKHVGTLSMTMDNKVSKDDIKSPITDEEISPVLKKVYT